MKSNSVGKLIELLKQYPENMIIKNEQNEEFCHIVNVDGNEVILSTKKPIAVCNRTGSYVYPTNTPGYFGFCPELDEDLFTFETSPLS